MARQLARIKRVTEHSGAKLIVVSVPAKPYVCKDGVGSLRAFGFTIPEDLAANATVDLAMQQAAAMNDLELFTATRLFRERCSTETLYYDLDGHFNKAGNRLFAERVTSIMEHLLSPEPSSQRP